MPVSDFGHLALPEHSLPQLTPEYIGTNSITDEGCLYLSSSIWHNLEVLILGI